MKVNQIESVEVRRPDEFNRVTLAMTNKGLAFLLGIANDNDMLIQDVIGQALVLFKAAKDAARDGKAVGVLPPDDADLLDVEFTGL